MFVTLAVMSGALALAGHPTAAAGFVGVSALVIGCGRLASRSAWTEANSEGISYFSGLWRTQHIPWHDISKIDIRLMHTRGAGTMRMARVTREGGKQRVLPMLVDSAAAPDPDLELKVDQLNQLLRHYRTSHQA